MRQIQFWAIAPFPLLATFFPNSWVIAKPVPHYTSTELPHRGSVFIAQANSPSSLEQAVIAEINRARTNPAAYAAWLQNIKQYLNGNILRVPGKPAIQTYTGAAGFDEAIRYMQSVSPMPAVSFSRGLYLAATDHARDQASVENVDHTGTDGSSASDRANRYGSSGGVWENISSGSHNSPEYFVMFMLIDDWVPSRGHRLNIMNPNHRVVGVACGSNVRWGGLCVMDFAAEYTERSGTASEQPLSPSVTGNPSRPVISNPPSGVAAGNYCGSGIVTQPTIRSDSHDSSVYKVWMDFRRGQETISSAACGRQYWIKEDSNHYNYKIPFVYLVDGRGACVVPYLYREEADGNLTVVRPAPECSSGS